MMPFLALALAAGSRGQEEAPVKEDARIEIVSFLPEKPVEGDILEVKYRVANDSKEVLVLGGGRPEYGSLFKDGDDLVHDMMAQQATRPVFYDRAQIVLPGEIYEGRMSLDALDSGLKVEISASGHAAETFVAYAAADGTGMERRFKRTTVGQLHGGKASSLIIDAKGRALTLSASRAVKPEPRAYPLAEARRKFVEPADSVRWSKTLDAWMMASPSRTAVVKRNGVVELPAGAFPALADYEAGKEKFQFRLGGVKTELAKTFRTYEGDGMYTRGTFIDIPRDRLVESLRRAREEGLSVAKVFYFFQSYYFELRAKE